MSEDQEECGICGLEIKDKYSYKLICNHEFHYECLMKSFQNTPKMKKEYNHCPYCRSEKNLLPLVNGIKIIDKNIHNLENINTYENIKCNTILKTGKNKGNKCDKFCKLGYFTCQRHTK